MAYASRSAWVVDELAAAHRKHPRVKVGYDSIGENIATAQTLGRMRRFNSKRLVPLQLRHIGAATATLSNATETGHLAQAPSKSLDLAVQAAVWRQAGGSRLFGRQHGKDISALLACLHALAAAAELKRQRDDDDDDDDSTILEPLTS